MLRRQSDGLGKELYLEKLDNGLEICILPKPGFHGKTAVFATRFGSNDSDFMTGSGHRIQVPGGVAHFLEHKLFDMPEFDTFEEFGKLGVSVNAYTSHFMTAYLFSGTDNFYPALNLLLDFVQTPYFTAETVEKEKGIIEQEIRMYDDHPDWQLYVTLLQNLYEKHPIREDIAGTVESIRKITPADLMRCYENFYHPGNMVLYLGGDFSPQEVRDFVKENQLRKNISPQVPPKVFFPEERKNIFRRHSVREMPVSAPQFALGFKHCPEYKHDNLLLDNTVMNIALDVLLGPGSKIYNELYEKQILQDDFNYSVTVNCDVAYTIMACSTNVPEDLEKSLLEALQPERVVQELYEGFSVSKRKMLGQHIMASDALFDIVNQYAAYKVRDMDLASYYPLLSSLTVDETIERFMKLFDVENHASSLILPKSRN